MFEFAYKSETNGDGVKMSNEGRVSSLIGHLRPQAPPQVGTPDAAPAENQGFSPGDPDLPRPLLSRCVPVSGPYRSCRAWQAALAKESEDGYNNMCDGVREVHANAR